ncbi:MAG: rod-binding protein [Candidatus Sumerlaeota bacterium]|nr:rod-binding protein [Candidatus Sumerlaeota bacterium]
MDISGIAGMGKQVLDALDIQGATAGRSLGSALAPQGNGNKSSVKDVAAAFERILMEMLTRSMRETVQTDDLFGESLGESHYRGFLDSLYLELASKKGSLGLRDMIEQQLDKIGTTKGK